jgi:hypothetical protein
VEIEKRRLSIVTKNLQPMKTLLNLFFIVMLGAAHSCSAQETPQVVSKDYEACCGTEPVEFTYDKKQVYVPNVFSPNKDGLNDYFAPFVNDVVTDIWGFSVYSAKGDTLLYQVPYFNTKMEINKYGWNGLRADGTAYKGLFHYKMRVDDIDANKHIVEGSACAVVCGPDAKVFQSKQGCFYPLQAGPEGKLIKDKANEEKICFQ